MKIPSLRARFRRAVAPHHDRSVGMDEVSDSGQTDPIAALQDDLWTIYERFRSHTMINPAKYLDTLRLL